MRWAFFLRTWTSSPSRGDGIAGRSTAGRRRVLVSIGLGRCLRTRAAARGDVRRASLPWHPLSGDTLGAVRAGIAPRARLAVWPALSLDVGAVLGSLPDEGLVEAVWQDTDGRVHSALADEEDRAELTVRMAGAVAAALMPVYADESVPLFTAVLSDSDGVVRARWRTEPTPDDRKWAFLKSLRAGQVVTGIVTETAPFGVTFVDIDGHVGITNIPELSWRSVAHPSDVMFVGQPIRTEVLGIDPVRGRLSLSLKALHDDPMKDLTAQVGTTVLGPVTKLVPFGVFVRIEERGRLGRAGAQLRTDRLAGGGSPARHRGRKCSAGQDPGC